MSAATGLIKLQFPSVFRAPIWFKFSDSILKSGTEEGLPEWIGGTVSGSKDLVMINVGAADP